MNSDASQPLSGAAQPAHCNRFVTQQIDSNPPVSFLCFLPSGHLGMCAPDNPPAAPVAVPAGQRRDLCRHCQYDFTNQATQCGRCPCCGDMLWDAPPAPLPPPQEPTDQAMLDTAMLMVDRLVSKFPQMEAAVIRPALKLEALQMMCTFGKEIRAAAASRIAQLERERDRAQDAHIEEIKKADKYFAQKSALMEAVEPFATNNEKRSITDWCLITDWWEAAASVYEQVKEGL